MSNMITAKRCITFPEKEKATTSFEKLPEEMPLRVLCLDFETTADDPYQNPLLGYFEIFYHGDLSFHGLIYTFLSSKETREMIQGYASDNGIPILSLGQFITKVFTPFCNLSKFS